MFGVNTQKTLIAKTLFIGALGKQTSDNLTGVWDQLGTHLVLIMTPDDIIESHFLRTFFSPYF